MKDLEILCRASAFLVPKLTACKQFEHRHHVLTSSHVVAPWKWPKYYPDEWIQHVNEQHTFYTMELREEDGTFLSQTELLPRSFHHASRDLAVLHLPLAEEEKTLSLLKQIGLEPLRLFGHDDDSSSSGGTNNDSSSSRRIELAENSAIVFHGHDVRNDDHGFGGDEADVRRSYHRIIPGTLSGRTPRQTFALTEDVLPDGMCGGPVLYNVKDSNGRGEKARCVGVVEGIVPADSAVAVLRNAAVFVENSDVEKCVLYSLFVTASVQCGIGRDLSHSTLQNRHQHQH